MAILVWDVKFEEKRLNEAEVLGEGTGGGITELNG